MASIPYFVISPTALLSFIGLLYGKDKTVPTPAKDWQQAIVDVVIPAQNEEENIVLALASLTTQTLKPRQIIVIDDASSDKTYEYVKDYAESIQLPIKIIHRDKPEGKTPGLKQQARESDADVLFVLDADTILRSEMYIERLVQELYQGVGIACACGIILPLIQQDKERLLKDPLTHDFAENHPAMNTFKNYDWPTRLLKKITALYREELYLFLQRFVYHAEMVFFGSIINPVGCAVAYRRQYLKDVFDQYETLLGNDLTTSEDIFIGFAFADYGYRNIQIDGVYSLTQEPPLSKLPIQIFKWSSAFLQSCYYFDDLVITPFKSVAALIKKIRESRGEQAKKIQEMRKIQEAYRQPFGVELTKKYGRPIGWFIFTSAVEKVSFPLIILMFIYLKLWWILLFTFVAEVLLYSIVIGIAHKNHRVANVIKSIFLAPIRYTVLMFDIIVIVFFIKDVMFETGRSWRK